MNKIMEKLELILTFEEANQEILELEFQRSDYQRTYEEYLLQYFGEELTWNNKKIVKISGCLISEQPIKLSPFFTTFMEAMGKIFREVDIIDNEIYY